MGFVFMPSQAVWRSATSLPGACGDASDADAERGKLLVEHAAARFVKLLDEVHRYPLSALRAGPLHKK